MAMSASEITDLIQNAFPDAQIEIKDWKGDQDHYQVLVRSEAFQGLPKVRQHQLVYQALGNRVGTTLHAISLRTEPLQQLP